MLLDPAVDFDCERILQIGFHRQNIGKKKKVKKEKTSRNAAITKKVQFKKLEQKHVVFSCCCCRCCFCFVLFCIFIPFYKYVDIKRFAVAMQQLTISCILKSVSFTASKTIQQNYYYYCIAFSRTQGGAIEIWSNFKFFVFRLCFLYNIKFGGFHHMLLCDQ